MRIVIDIPGEIIEYIKNNGCLSVIYNDEVAKAMIDSTPLSVGHGRLIDADKLIPTCKFRGDCHDERCEMCSDNAVSFSDIETAPTVIEADKGEE